jgi:hypothetical protein
VRREKFARPKPDAWFRSDKHLASVRVMRCRACGIEPPAEAAHVRKGADGAGGKKPSDYFAVPLCERCHKVQHQIGEPAFWSDIDPIEIALQIAISSPCPRTREAAFEEHRRRYG